MRPHLPPPATATQQAPAGSAREARVSLGGPASRWGRPAISLGGCLPCRQACCGGLSRPVPVRRAAGRLPIRGPGLRPGSRGQRARVLCSHLGGGLPDARSPGHARSEAAAFPVGGRRVLAGAGRRGTRHAARGAVAPWPGRNRTGRDTRAPCCPSHCAPQTHSLLKRVLVGSGSAGRSVPLIALACGGPGRGLRRLLCRSWRC